MIKTLRNNVSIILMGFAVIASSVSLMVVSQNVYDKQSKIKRMERESLATEWEIRALNAEMAYLSRPDRMDQLASAMANSITPSAGNEIMMISPASFSPFTQTDLSVIPYRKPSKSKPASVSASTPSTSSQKQDKQKQDFSSLLDSIGGGG